MSANRGGMVTYIKIHEFIKDKLIRLEGGMCEYAKGWSDEEVAKSLSVPHTSVRNLRTKTYGKLKEQATRGNSHIYELYTELDARIAACEKAAKDAVNAIENCERRLIHIENWGHGRGLGQIPGRVGNQNGNR